MHGIVGQASIIIIACKVTHCVVATYRIRGNFRGMKFSLYTKQTGFSRLYFRGSVITTFRGFRVSFYVIRVLHVLPHGREDLSYYFQRQKDRY